MEQDTVNRIAAMRASNPFWHVPGLAEATVDEMQYDHCRFERHNLESPRLCRGIVTLQICQGDGGHSEQGTIEHPIASYRLYWTRRKVVGIKEIERRRVVAFATQSCL